MCGIVGLVGSGENCSGLEHSMQQMVGALGHRGPDGTGIWLAPGIPVGLGHTRLAVVDLSAAGRQPMTSASGRWTITYNGEIYNSAAIARRLSHFKPRGHSDTEVLVEAIDQWGVVAALQESIGMFAIGAWDSKEQTLWLARDRYGQKPLYFGRNGNGLAFASELGAIERLPGMRPGTDQSAVHEFLRLGRVPGDHCILTGFAKVPPAHLLSYKLGSSSVSQPVPYWDAAAVLEEAREQQIVPEQAAEDEVESLLAEATRIRLRSDVPVGVFLSGGVDSTVISALAQGQSNSPIRTITVKNLDDPLLDESRYAAKAAANLGTEHLELPVSGQDCLDLVPQLGSIYDEPFADSSQIPTYLISKKARGHVTVVLGGDGGDEIFAGYNRHVWTGRAESWKSRTPGPLGSLVAAALRAPSDQHWNRAQALLPAKRRLGHPADKARKVADLLSGEHGRSTAVADLWPTPPMASPPIAVSGRGGRARTIRGLRGLLLHDITTYLPDDILVKVDRASMACGLEARAPFLDHRLWELSCRLPDDQLVGRGRGKRVLRKIAARHVPSEVFERPKAGFSIPLGVWLRNDLRPWAEDMLSSAAIESAGLLDPAPVRAAWADHLSGRHERDQQLWAPLMLQAWALGRQ